MRTLILVPLFLLLFFGCTTTRDVALTPADTASAYGEINLKAHRHKARVRLADGTNHRVTELLMLPDTTTWVDADSARVAVPTADVRQVVVVDHWDGLAPGLVGGFLLGTVVGGAVSNAKVEESDFYAKELIVMANAISTGLLGGLLGGAIGVGVGKRHTYRFLGSSQPAFLVHGLSCELSPCAPIPGQACYVYRCGSGEEARIGQVVGRWRDMSEVEQEVARRIHTPDAN